MRRISETENRPEEYAHYTAAVPEDAWEESLSQQELAERFGKRRDQVRNELRDHGTAEEDVKADVAELLRLLSR